MPFRYLCLCSVVLLAACPRAAKQPEDLQVPDQQVPDRSSAPAPAVKDSPSALKVTELSFAGPAGHRPTASFSRGEVVVSLFTLSNFTYKDGRADLVVDIVVSSAVRPSERVLVVGSLPVLAGKAPTVKPGEVRSAAKLAISPAVTPGRYRVSITAHDRLGGRKGEASADFTIVGVAGKPSAQLQVTGLRHAGDQRMPAGSVAPLVFELRGLRGHAGPKSEQSFEASISAELRDAAGKVVSRHDDTLIRKKLLFRPLSYPRAYAITIPSKLAAGKYAAHLQIHDRISGSRAKASLPVEVIPRSFGIYNLHLNDAASLARRAFRLGEQTFVRLSVQGFAVRGKRASFEIDLGISGPDGGVYLARKNAAPLSAAAAASAARHGRHAVQLPIVLPALAPVGSYKLVLRVRDRVANKTAARQLRFELKGAAPRPLKRFAIDKLQVRLRPDLPTIKGDSFISGRPYHLELRVGGVQVKKLRRMTFGADIEAGITLSNILGKTVAETKQLFRFKRQVNYRPLRVVLGAQWKVPAGLPPGLYTLRVHALNRVDDMVSVMNRRVAIFSAGPMANAPRP